MENSHLENSELSAFSFLAPTLLLLDVFSSFRGHPRKPERTPGEQPKPRQQLGRAEPPGAYFTPRLGCRGRRATGRRRARAHGAPRAEPPPPGAGGPSRRARAWPPPPPPLYLAVLAPLHLAVPGLQLAAQLAVVGLLLLQLLLVGVHLAHQVRVPLLQAAPGHLGALGLALQLRHLLLQQGLAGRGVPAVEGEDGDHHQQRHEDEGRQTAAPPVGPEAHHGGKPPGAGGASPAHRLRPHPRGEKQGRGGWKAAQGASLPRGAGRIPGGGGPWGRRG